MDFVLRRCNNFQFPFRIFQWKRFFQYVLNISSSFSKAFKGITTVATAVDYENFNPGETTSKQSAEHTQQISPTLAEWNGKAPHAARMCADNTPLCPQYGENH